MEIMRHRVIIFPKRTIERRVKQLRDDKKVVFRGAPKTGGYYAAD